MTRLWQFITLSLLLLTCFLNPAHGAANEDFKDKVVVIQIGQDSLTSKQSFDYMRRVINKATETKAKAVIFEINTPGGNAWETSEMLKTLQEIKIPSYAFVNNKAMSAGALISVACDAIYMAPGSSIGAAAVINSDGSEMDPMLRQKLDSGFSAIVRAIVEQKGHNVELVESMMIPAEKKKTFGDVTLGKGKLLSLSAKEAVSLDENGNRLLAKGIVSNIDELMIAESIVAPVIIANPTTFEQIAMWIGWASPFLILLGIGGIYLEFKTPGFGIGGIVAIVAFALFFFGNNIAGNLAGYEMVALFVIGILLILAEVFFIPGTFIAGITGVLLVLVSLFGGMISSTELDYIVTNQDWSFDAILGLIMFPLFKLSLGLFGSTILILILMRYLPETAIFRRFANDVISGGSDEGEAVSISSPLQIGSFGEALTELKPNGKALFNGATYEVFSRDGILTKGTPLRVIEKRSFDFVVEKAETAPASSDESAQQDEPDNA